MSCKSIWNILNDQFRPLFSVLYVVGELFYELTDVIDLVRVIYDDFRRQRLSCFPKSLSKVARMNLTVNTCNDSDVWFPFISKVLSNIDAIKEVFLTWYENPLILWSYYTLSLLICQNNFVFVLTFRSQLCILWWNRHQIALTLTCILVPIM